MDEARESFLLFYVPISIPNIFTLCIFTLCCLFGAKCELQEHDPSLACANEVVIWVMFPYVETTRRLT